MNPDCSATKSKGQNCRLKSGREQARDELVISLPVIVYGNNFGMSFDVQNLSDDKSNKNINIQEGLPLQNI